MEVLALVVLAAAVVYVVMRNRKAKAKLDGAVDGGEGDRDRRPERNDR